MAKTVKDTLTSSTPYSVSKFDMKHRSDGRGAIKTKGKPKPVTETDHKIHLGHIIGSGQYNLDHDHDHSEELAFDYERLKKEVPHEADRLASQTTSLLGPIFRRMGLELKKRGKRRGR